LSKSDCKLLYTPGEPAGIGPDIWLQYLAGHPSSSLVGICDPALIYKRAEELNIRADINECAGTDDIVDKKINIIPVSMKSSCKAGTINPINSPYVIECLETATRLCIEGHASGLVTGPINKAAINDAGIAFTGHTEWLADRAGCKQVVMMLATDKLRVALVTTHLPLREVADSITKELLREIIVILERELRIRFDIEKPHILICGLNPHAGENGHLGTEEIDILIPVLEQMRQEKYSLEGPLPADTLFTARYLDQADAVLAMYHDQGLPVLKHTGFGSATNITLGLPFIRTSVDHGTALALAGTGLSDPGSLACSVRIARQMALTPSKTSSLTDWGS